MTPIVVGSFASSWRHWLGKTRSFDSWVWSLSQTIRLYVKSYAYIISTKRYYFMFVTENKRLTKTFMFFSVVQSIDPSIVLCLFTWDECFGCSFRSCILCSRATQNPTTSRNKNSEINGNNKKALFKLVQELSLAKTRDFGDAEMSESCGESFRSVQINQN